MAKDKNVNAYEEARQQRLLENKKRFEDLGISKIAAVLSDLKTDQKPQQSRARPKPSTIAYTAEPRRSARTRNPVSSYRDDVDIEIPHLRKRSKFSSSWASYIARPIEECRTASYEERANAIKCAEKIQSNLQSQNPSFVKSMVRSHVYSCFWLGLPTRFCVDHLPKSTTDMVLEDEEGSEYEAIFISKRTGLSGGWRAFALDHKLDDGDALVFELIEPTRFKIYIVKASETPDPDDHVTAPEDEDCRVEQNKCKRQKKVGKTDDSENETPQKDKDNAAQFPAKRQSRRGK